MGIDSLAVKMGKQYIVFIIRTERPLMKSLTYTELEKLTTSERQVYKVLSDGLAKSDDVDKIAKLCKLTDLHVKVALQLLKHKQILSTENIIK